MKRCCMMLAVLLMMVWPVQAMATPPVQDGQYTIEVSLTGGTGRASIASPAPLAAAGGTLTATIEWSSPYYEYMLVDGTHYYPIQTEGNATFEIPVTLDVDIPVTAQTIAMSQPHEIDYVLCFDSATLNPQGGNMTTWQIILIAAAVCVGIAVVISVAESTRRKARSSAQEGKDKR